MTDKARMLELLKAGTRIPEACRLSGVSHVDHVRWRKEDEAYDTAVRQSRWRNADPTPAEIEERARAIRDKWTQLRWAEQYNAPRPWQAKTCRSEGVALAGPFARRMVDSDILDAQVTTEAGEDED